MASICSICHACAETTFHLFLQYRFASKMWYWFSSILKFPMQLNAVFDIWNICGINWTPQCKLAITACLVNILNTIWFTRNQARFQDKVIHWRSAINMIISSTIIISNNTNGAFGCGEKVIREN
jgi:hypothetical protein